MTTTPRTPAQTRRPLGALLSLLLAACGDNLAATAPPPTLTTGDPLKLSELVWNGKMQDFGRIDAVTEIYDDTLILGEQGAVVLTSGVPLATDGSVKGWRTATVVPAADLSGEWAMAVDKDGAVRRLRNRSSMEDTSDRYGLAGTPVLELAALGAGGVAFALADGLAVADGSTVTRYPGAWSRLSGMDGRVAGVVDGKLRSLALPSGTATDYALGEITGVVFDAAGKLVVTTTDALYQEDAGASPALVRRHQSAEPIRALARAGSVLWLRLGDGLAQVEGDKLRRPPADSALGVLGGEARLFGSPGGALWTVQDGRLRLLAQDSGGGADQDLWRRSVLPMYARLCSTCHLPGGSSGIDLSTYKTWAPRRGVMDLRVLQGKPTPMPPAGAGTLTADEAAGLKAWIANVPMGS